MRVIAGEYKGRRLESPQGNSVRPTTDKVKEALFSILSNRLWGSDVLDLFAGTGGLGIEALSRGASSCLFCDSSRESVRVIKDNIAHCGAERGAIVLNGDFRKILSSTDRRFDIILLDPPYDRGLLAKCFELIKEGSVLKEGGVIVAEHRKEEILPEEFYGFTKIKEKRYGIIMLSIYS